MRKLVSVLLTLAVAVSLMAMPAVTSASPGIGLNAVGSATAEISTATYVSPTHSVKLYVKDGSVDWAEVSIPVDIALKDINKLSFWERVTSYTTSGWDVNVVLGVDVDGDGVFEADVAGWHVTDSHNATLLGGDSFIEMDGALGPLGAPLGWTQVNALTTARWWTPNFTGDGLSKDLYCSFADLLTKIGEGGWDTNILNTGMKVKCVKLLIGGSGSWMGETAYVDDVTINGKTYDFEPTSSVGLTADVPDIVAISVDPTVIDFGTLYPGQTSSEESITVTNIGTHKVNVDADVSGSSSALFYYNLQMTNNDGWTYRSWGNLITGLAMGEVDEVQTQLPVPSDYTPSGTETGLLIFTATGV
jgi:hypothetical protein